MQEIHTSDSNQRIICPNCGFPAEKNYCAQCGQETHLHKETFWALVLHFIGHYFHYDSKFWQTLKTLWFKPGKLSKDYIEGKRARYIPPISLYIFISAVYFICSFTLKEYQEKGNHEAISQVRKQIDALNNAQGAKDTLQFDNSRITLDIRDSVGLGGYMRKKFSKMKEDNGRDVKERIAHNIPKIFFIMIPIVALVLKLLFLKRKSMYFVHHAIFSLHIHSFLFSIFLFTLIPGPRLINLALVLVCFLTMLWYFMKASKTMYGIGTRRAVLNTAIIVSAYFMFLSIASLFLLAIALIMA